MSFDECDNISNLFVFHSILVRFVEHGNEWIQQTDAGRFNRVASLGPVNPPISSITNRTTEVSHAGQMTPDNLRLPSQPEALPSVRSSDFVPR